MIQELIELRNNILQGRYPEALELIDELEGMGRQAILRNIQSYLLRLLIHLIKNQVEQRLTNSWAASISNSIRQIQKLNLKDNKTSYYVQQDEWLEMLEAEYEAAVDAASSEIQGGEYTPFELLELIDQSQIIETAQQLLTLTDQHSSSKLSPIIRESLTELPGGQLWRYKK